MERLTQTSNSGGVAFTFDLDITCQPSEIKKILKIAEKLKCYEDAEEQGIYGKWIPVTEKLPEDEVDVLVWFEYFRYGNYNRLFRNIGISYTYNGEWSGFVNGQSGWRQLKVIAWMPLPKPYRESEGK